MTLTAEPATLASRVDQTLGAFLGSQDSSPLREAIERFIGTGGKRLRPAFCYWAWHGNAPSEQDDSVAIIAGAALEMFHCFALIHDDIIDASSMRRGRPTVHEEFASWHAEHRLHGDSPAFGRNAALLAGDLCATWSADLFDQCQPTSHARRLFSVTRAEAIAGEFLDITTQASTDVERTLRVARLKTARYSVTRPLQIGAALAGADCAGMQEFGDPLGEAFQLRDDILGVFGDPSHTGKSNVDDLRQAKPTALLALTWRRANPRQLHVLRSTVGRPGLTQEAAMLVRDVMVKTGALAETEARIARGHAQALAALDALHIGETAREHLRALAGLAVSRPA